MAKQLTRYQRGVRDLKIYRAQKAEDAKRREPACRDSDHGWFLWLKPQQDAADIVLWQKNIADLQPRCSEQRRVYGNDTPHGRPSTRATILKEIGRPWQKPNIERRRPLNSPVTKSRFSA
jgi:hypothetical protein